MVGHQQARLAGGQCRTAEAVVFVPPYWSRVHSGIGSVQVPRLCGPGGGSPLGLRRPAAQREPKQIIFRSHTQRQAARIAACVRPSQARLFLLLPRLETCRVGSSSRRPSPLDERPMEESACHWSPSPSQTSTRPPSVRPFSSEVRPPSWLGGSFCPRSLSAPPGDLLAQDWTPVPSA
jgi:hypothetical protein